MTIDTPTMENNARLLIMPRSIPRAESKAAMAPLVSPITNNLTGRRSCLSGEKVMSANAVMTGEKKMTRPRILSSNSVIIQVAISSDFIQGEITSLIGFLLSPDYPIRSRQHIGRNREADLFGGFEVDRQLELLWLLDGYVGGLCPLEQFVHKDRCAPG